MLTHYLDIHLRLDDVDAVGQARAHCTDAFDRRQVAAAFVLRVGGAGSVTEGFELGGVGGVEPRQRDPHRADRQRQQRDEHHDGEDQFDLGGAVTRGTGVSPVFSVPGAMAETAMPRDGVRRINDSPAARSRTCLCRRWH